MSNPVDETRLSDAQRRALREIRSPGGHAFGEYAYLSRRTAEALERLGLVVLGKMYRYDYAKGADVGRSWAIAVGAPAPDGFRSRAEIRAADDAFLADLKLRQEAAEARRQERRAALLAFARANPRPGETPAEHAERVARVEVALKNANDATLDAAEAAVAERRVSNATVARQDGEGSTA